MLTHHFSNASTLVYGCMGLGGQWDDQPVTEADKKHAQTAIEAALAAGITVFDHADIYTFGKAETVFGQVLAEHPTLRDQMIIQSKCAIRFADDAGPKRYDASAGWITQSVEDSLSRLGLDSLDVLLLHRPDPLMELNEVAETLTRLINAGKIQHVGVSNMNGQQIAFLQQALGSPIVVNQLEMSLTARRFIEEGITTNTDENPHYGFTAGTMEYCQQHDVQLQAWGALAQGRFSGGQPNNETEQATADLVAELAEFYNVSAEAVVLGWLTRHPACIQPVIGTTNPQRIAACAQVDQLRLSRGHWYQLLETVRGQELP